MITDRKNFLMSAVEDEATVPAGVGEEVVEPKPVPLRQLRVEKLNMQCEWQSCKCNYSDYEDFQKHVFAHIEDIHVMEKDNHVEYVCLWDICGYTTRDYHEMVRHIHCHSYHAKLLAIGLNGRATLKLKCCKKDSSKRNQLTPYPQEHQCMWYQCEDKFNSIQAFFDHVRLHTNYSKSLVCSWSGCGAKFPRRVLLTMHVRSHTGERLIACYHCGQHFACNRKLSDHLNRQNVDAESPFRCSMCGLRCASAYLLSEHSRGHVSAHACSLCDMSAPSLGALATHVRYRHLHHLRPDHKRPHRCTLCEYRAIRKWDLQKHMRTHKKNKDMSEDENSECELKVKNVSKKKYACHMCPEKSMKVFSRGTRLTSHLVKVHGAQWPSGHSRFRYQISEDGMYRLTTTRYEVLEVSKKIVDGYSGPKESLSNQFEFKLDVKSKATARRPTRYAISLKNDEKDSGKLKEVKLKKIKVKKVKLQKIKVEEESVEITMFDVDDQGNVLNSQVINSNYLRVIDPDM